MVGGCDNNDFTMNKSFFRFSSAILGSICKIVYHFIFMQGVDVHLEDDRISS